MTTFADADYRQTVPSTFRNISGLSDNIARELNGLISPLFLMEQCIITDRITKQSTAPKCHLKLFEQEVSQYITSHGTL